MASPKDSKRQALIDKVLGDPDLYPDELMSHVVRKLEGHPMLKLESFQLPNVEIDQAIGGSGKPAFENSWVNYALGYDAAEYYKDPLGRVRLSGAVKSGGAGTVIFTLPQGYRPPALKRFHQGGDTLANHAYVDVNASGQVIHISGGTAFVSLEGISFRAA